MRNPESTHGVIRNRLDAAGNYPPFDVDATLIGLVDAPPAHVLVETASDGASTTWKIQWTTDTELGQITATAPQPEWNRYSDPVDGQQITATLIPWNSVDCVTFTHEASTVTHRDVEYILKGSLVLHHGDRELTVPPLGMPSTHENKVSEFQTAVLAAWRKHQAPTTASDSSTR